jgi:hypothetical protein
MKDMLNKIINGDCIETLSSIAEPFADLIFADPLITLSQAASCDSTIIYVKLFIIG